MKRDSAMDSNRWRGFSAQLCRHWASLWPQVRADVQQMREEWLEVTAVKRQVRQLRRARRQRITGLASPTRRQVRRALREHREDDQGPA